MVFVMLSLTHIRIDGIWAVGSLILIDRLKKKKVRISAPLLMCFLGQGTPVLNFFFREGYARVKFRFQRGHARVKFHLL